MQSSIQRQTTGQPAPTEPTTSRLRTVTGNRFPRKCACGCGFRVAGDPAIHYVVNFGGLLTGPAFLRAHMPDPQSNLGHQIHDSSQIGECDSRQRKDECLSNLQVCACSLGTQRGQAGGI